LAKVSVSFPSQCVSLSHVTTSTKRTGRRRKMALILAEFASAFQRLYPDMEFQQETLSRWITNFSLKFPPSAFLEGVKKPGDYVVAFTQNLDTIRFSNGWK
jgi:hypothetical protein